MALEILGKTITDPLYGNIKLTKLESELVSTPVFQRLHNIKQLGLGHLVFPSAAYSRFSHSVGACVNADRILSAIEANRSGKTFTDKERQSFRIAALFHDLGHFPFSHTTEHASKRFFREGLYKKAGEDERQGSLEIMGDESASQPVFIDHEDTGKMILIEDEAIDKIFKNHSNLIEKTDIEQIFLDTGLSTIISSDLDCDRLDYLKRTALHSGAPYGAVDVDFIISKATVDEDVRFCFDRKATRATDHLLMSRFYDFMQIPYHKTVAALEWSLEESVVYLLRTKRLNLSKDGIGKMLQNKQWAYFDDGALLHLMRKCYAEGTEHDDNHVAMDHLSAVIKRKPAKMVCSWECLLDAGNKEHELREDVLRYKINEAAKDMGLDINRFKIWSAPFKLSKAGPILQRMPLDTAEYGEQEEEHQQLIHILEKGQFKSKPLIDLPNAISHHLAKLKYRVLRVYYLPGQTESEAASEKLRTFFSGET